MKSQSIKIVTGTILNDEDIITFEELCGACGVTADILIEFVEEGLIEPLGESQQEWRFTMIAVWRSQTALRLQRDLDLNTSGIGLVLDLLEEIRFLRTRVKDLENILS